MKQVFFALVLVMAVFAPRVATASEPDARNVSVLAVFPAEQSPSHVHYTSDGEAARGLLIPFGSLVSAHNQSKRSAELGAKLDTALGDYDRHQVLLEAIQKAFEQKSAMYVIHKTTDTAGFMDGKKPNARAHAEGHRYVLVLEEVFSGLSMLHLLATRTDDVAPLATFRYSVYDASNIKLLAKGVASGNGMTKKHISEAPQDRELFVSAYPEIAKGVALQIMGNLFRADVLHSMAASVGRGDEVPQVSLLMKKYERRFKYTLAPEKGWKRVKMNTPYANVLEPKSDLKYQLGIRFEIDLLVPELGQDVDSVEGYMVPWGERVAEAGVDMATLGVFSDITLPGYSVYSFATNTEGGRNISALRILSPDMIEVVTVIFTKDFDALYPLHRAAIERNIVGAQVQIKG